MSYMDKMIVKIDPEQIFIDRNYRIIPCNQNIMKKTS